MSVFGELNLTNSRAVSDDEDDEFQVENEQQLASKKNLYWFDNKQTPINVDQLLVACDKTTSAFLQSYLLNHYDNTNGDKQLIGVITTNTQLNIELKHFNENDKNKRSKTINFSNYIYLLNLNRKTYLTVQCYDEIKLNEIYDLTSQIAARVMFETAIILSSQHQANYYGNLPKVPAIRYLSNTNNVSWCDRLDEPNFITGFSAAVMNMCISRGKPVISYVCYKSSLEIDISSIKEFFKVFLTSTQNIFIENQLTRDTLVSLSKIFSSTSGLYI